MSEPEVISLKQRLGQNAGGPLLLEDQLRWAVANQHFEPRSPWRLRVYNLMADHDVQIDWLGMPFSMLHRVLDDLDQSRLREQLSVGHLREQLLDLGSHEEGRRSINYWLHKEEILDRLVGTGSRNPYHQPAITSAECQMAFEKGMHQADEEIIRGAHWVGLRMLNPAVRVFAAMQLFMHAGVPLNISLKPLLKADRLESVAYVAEKAVRRHPMSRNPMMGLTFFGAYELAFACGFVIKMAREGRFTLLSGLEGYATAFVAELLQAGSSEYVTFTQRAPQLWREAHTEAFEGPAVFQATAADPADVQLRLALFHLHSCLNA